MEILKRGDVIIDHYGNYYYAVDQKGDTIRIVNAFLDLAMRRRLDDTFFELHEGKMVGEPILERIKGHINMIINKKNRFKMIPLETLEEKYTVIIDNLMDYE